MPHALTELNVRTVRRPAQPPVEELHTEVCVVGAGISGMSAALTSAQLGRRVALVDALPVLGGQCANSLIGLFCGVYGNGPDFHQLTHGIFTNMFADLDATGDISYNRRRTMTVNYDEVAVGRWMEQQVQDHRIEAVTSASVLSVENQGGRIEAVTFATRYGLLRVVADALIDATGDAALTWEAGLDCRVPERTIWGSQQVRLENLDPAHAPPAEELAQRVHDKAESYGLVRKDGLAFFFPGRDTAVMNMTHVEAPLEPVAASRAQLEGRAQADLVVDFLKAEFPDAFGRATVRLYGFPGRRQTRWIAGEYQLSVDDVVQGTTFDDAIARTAWPIELHDRPDGYVWEVFEPDHVHYVPLRSITPQGAVNLLAAGRCVDGDAAALSSVRVMGPCAAMGEAAAHALDLADGGAISDISWSDLRTRVAHNVTS